MAKKVNAAFVERLKALGIKTTNEDEARKKLLDILVKNDIDGMEEEDTESLIEMAESMIDDDDVPTDEEEEEIDKEEEEEVDDEVEDEEAENDALAEEVEAEQEDSEEEEADKEEEEEVDDEVEDETPQPKKKAEKKTVSTKKNEKGGKTTKTAKEETEQPKIGKRGVKLEPRNNEEDRKAFDFLKKYFPEDEFEYNWIVTNGVTIKHKGANSKRAAVTLDACRKLADGTCVCHFYLLTFAKSLDVLDEAGIEYEICWHGAPFVKKVSFTEVEDIIKAVIENIKAHLGKIDQKLGDNRKKLEAAIKKTTKDSKPAAKSKKIEDEVEELDDEVEDEVDDEVEDEEEDEKPAKAVKGAKKTKKIKK